MEDFKSVLYKIIGERIKAKRKELSLNQDFLSKSLRLGRSSISNIESGRHQVPLINLYELANLLKLNIYDLIPTNEEVLKALSDGIYDLDEYIDKQRFNRKSKNSVQQILKKLGNDDI